MMDFDVFISFKNSDADGNLTPDHEIGRKLHAELERRGVHTFFSGDSIKRVGDTEYKKVIDDALDTAEILVVLGTKLSYIRSKWVEYEWESFEHDILNGIKKNAKIMTYTSSIDTRELPRTLRNYQNYVINETSIEEVADFIEKQHARIIEANRQDADPENSAEAPDEVADDPEPAIETEVAVPVGRKMPRSVYSSAMKSEFRRLEIQANNSLPSDQKVISYVLDKLSPEEKLNVLDVGSAYGFVTSTRFSPLPEVGHVIAFDYNADVIDKAKDLFMDDEKLLFYVMDLTSEDFEDQMNELLAEMDIPKFDIIFSSLVLLHLDNPDKALRRLRKFLKKDGYIIVRGSDDGSKLCYPHSEVMDDIIRKTMELGGTSDRLNGRKLYTQLVDAGFHDVRVFSDMKDLSMIDFDDRDDLFKESFSYRINFFEKRRDEEPDNPKAQADYEWMKDALERFETQFFERSFWYCEYDYVAVGRK